MTLSLEGQLEAETLADWVHLDRPADNGDLAEFLCGQLAQAKLDLAAKRYRHEQDPALEQEIRDLTELAGVVLDAYRWQRRQPVNPSTTVTSRGCSGSAESRYCPGHARLCHTGPGRGMSQTRGPDKAGTSLYPLTSLED